MKAETAYAIGYYRIETVAESGSFSILANSRERGRLRGRKESWDKPTPTIFHGNRTIVWCRSGFMPRWNFRMETPPPGISPHPRTINITFFRAVVALPLVIDEV